MKMQCYVLPLHGYLWLSQIISFFLPRPAYQKQSPVSLLSSLFLVQPSRSRVKYKKLYHFHSNSSPLSKEVFFFLSCQWMLMWRCWYMHTKVSRYESQASNVIIISYYRRFSWKKNFLFCVSLLSNISGVVIQVSPIYTTSFSRTQRNVIMKVCEFVCAYCLPKTMYIPVFLPLPHSTCSIIILATTIVEKGTEAKTHQPALPWNSALKLFCTQSRVRILFMYMSASFTRKVCFI